MTTDPTQPDNFNSIALGSHTPAVILRDPVHVAAALPYLLGFTPQRSLVLLGFRESSQGTTLVVAARYDLPAHTDPFGDEAQELVDHAVHAFARARTINTAVITIVDDHPGSVAGALPHLALADSLITAFDEADIAVKDVSYTDSQRVFIYGCTDDRWPSHNAEITHAIRNDVAAGFVFAGLAPASNRNDLRTEIAHRDDELSAQVTSDLQTHHQPQPALLPAEVSDLATRLTASLCAPELLDAHAIAELGRGLVNVKTRDAVLWDLSRATHHERGNAVTNLLRATTHLPDHTVAQPATVLAVEMWMRGDGARANIAIDRALTADPNTSLAQLVSAALSHGLPPQSFADLFTGTLTREMCTGESELPPAAQREATDLPATAITKPLAI